MKTENLATNLATKYGIDRLYQYRLSRHNEDWAIDYVNSPAKDRDLYLNEHTVTYRITPFLFAKVYLT